MKIGKRERGADREQLVKKRGEERRHGDKFRRPVGS